MNPPVLTRRAAAAALVAGLLMGCADDPEALAEQFCEQYAPLPSALDTLENADSAAAGADAARDVATALADLPRPPPVDDDLDRARDAAQQIADLADQADDDPAQPDPAELARLSTDLNTATESIDAYQQQTC